MKRKLLYTGVIITVVLAVLVYVSLDNVDFTWWKGSSQQQALTIEGDSYIDPVNQESSITPIAPTIDFNDPELLADVQSIPKSPSVVHIREVFNRYLSGNYGEINDDTVFDISPSEYAEGDMVGGFDSFDKSLYQSRFIINAVHPGVMGGQNYDIIFIDHPEKIYIAWIYMEGDGTKPNFRTFWLNTGYPANYGEELFRLNPRLKTDSTLSI